MATSGSTDFTLPAGDVVKGALRRLGVLGRGSQPHEAEDMTDGLQALNLIAKQWMYPSDGAASMKMWTRERGVLIPKLHAFEYMIGGSSESNGVALLDDLTQTTTLEAATHIDTELPMLADVGQTIAAPTGGKTLTVGDRLGVVSSNTSDWVWFDIAQTDSTVLQYVDKTFQHGDRFWSIPVGWQIFAGTAQCVGGTGNELQSYSSATSSATGIYKVVFTVTDIVGAGARVVVGATNGTTRATAGTYIETITSTTQATFGIDPVDASTTFKITYFDIQPVYEVTPAGTTTVSGVSHTLGHTFANGANVYHYTPGKVGKPNSILSMQRRESNGDDVVLTPMLRPEYDAYPDKDNRGDPTSFHYQQNRDDGTLFFDSGPTDINDQFRFTFRREIEDFDSIVDNVDFPSEWERALVWELASELAPEHGKSFDETMKRNHMEAVAIARYSNPQNVNAVFERDRPEQNYDYEDGP